VFPGVQNILLAARAPATAPPPVDLYVAWDGSSFRTAAFGLAADVRRHGHSAQLELAGRSLKGQLKAADRIGARYVAILSGDGTAMKDMQTGEQRTVEIETVLHFLTRGFE